MTPEQMADLIADEMIEDIKELTGRLLRFYDRYRQYGAQFKETISKGKREELESVIKEYTEALEGAEE